MIYALDDTVLIDLAFALAVDSLSSMDIPAWGYGLRYQYGSK